MSFDGGRTVPRKKQILAIGARPYFTVQRHSPGVDTLSSSLYCSVSPIYTATRLVFIIFIARPRVQTLSALEKSNKNTFVTTVTLFVVDRLIAYRQLHTVKHRTLLGTGTCSADELHNLAVVASYRHVLRVKEPRVEHRKSATDC